MELNRAQSPLKTGPLVKPPAARRRRAELTHQLAGCYLAHTILVRETPYWRWIIERVRATTGSLTSRVCSRRLSSSGNLCMSPMLKSGTSCAGTTSLKAPSRRTMMKRVSNKLGTFRLAI